MRGYARSVVSALNQTREVNTFIPALASLVRHEAHRGADRPRGTLRRPIEVLAVQLDPPEFRPDHRIFRGAAAAVFHGRHDGVDFVRRCSCSYLFVRRIIVGPEAEGVFTLFAIVFFLIGVALFGIGLLGEYVGRIYAQVRERPRYIVEAVLEEGETALERCYRAAPRCQVPPRVARRPGRPR